MRLGVVGGVILILSFDAAAAAAGVEGTGTKVRIGGGGVLDMIGPIEERNDCTLARGLVGLELLLLSLPRDAEDSTQSSSRGMMDLGASVSSSTNDDGRAVSLCMSSLMVTSACVVQYGITRRGKMGLFVKVPDESK